MDNLVTIIVTAITAGLATGLLWMFSGYRNKRFAAWKKDVRSSELEISQLDLDQIKTDDDRWDFMTQQMDDLRAQANTARRKAGDALVKATHQETKTAHLEATHLMTLTKITYSVRFMLAVCTCEAHSQLEKLLETLEQQLDNEG